MPLDEDLFRALNGAGNPILDPVAIALGVVGLIFIAMLWAVPLWIGGRRREAIDLPLLLLVDGILVYVLKALLMVSRPEIGTMLAVPLDDVTDFSFPSGHTTRAFAAALLLSVRLRDWRWGVPLFAYAIAVGLSRVYVGVHWPSDILGGALLGLAWTFAFLRLAETTRYTRWRDALVDRIRSLRRAA